MNSFELWCVKTYMLQNGYFAPGMYVSKYMKSVLQYLDCMRYVILWSLILICILNCMSPSWCLTYIRVRAPWQCIFTDYLSEVFLLNKLSYPWIFLVRYFIKCYSVKMCYEIWLINTKRHKIPALQIMKNLYFNIICASIRKYALKFRKFLPLFLWCNWTQKIWRFPVNLGLFVVYNFSLLKRCL
jgi:hypothetical protein